MVLVLFEVKVKKEYKNDYLAMAGKLKEHLVNADGFVRAERFSSLVSEGKLLSLSVWESEDAVTRWRNLMEHRTGQRQGWELFFESYTVIVAEQVRSYSNIERSEAPKDSNSFLLSCES